MTKKSLIEKLRKAAESLGWKWRETEGGEKVELFNFSPAGEKFYVMVGKNNINADLRKEYLDFDPDEHVEMLIPIRGTRGVPKSIKTLCYDAEKIEDMLYELWAKLLTIEEEEEAEDELS